jgi:hypothetical protein
MKFVVIAALLFCCITSCKKPESFEYRDLRNFKIDSLGFDKSTISMDLIYFNPNNYGVDLKKVDCDVFVQHSYLGTYSLDTTMHISKRSEFAIPSRMQVDMKNLLKNALTSFFATELLVEVKGTTRVGKAGIYITVPFTYSGWQKFNLLN